MCNGLIYKVNQSWNMTVGTPNNAYNAYIFFFLIEEINCRALKPKDIDLNHNFILANVHIKVIKEWMLTCTTITVAIMLILIFKVEAKNSYLCHILKNNWSIPMKNITADSLGNFTLGSKIWFLWFCIVTAFVLKVYR